MAEATVDDSPTDQWLKLMRKHARPTPTAERMQEWVEFVVTSELLPGHLSDRSFVNNDLFQSAKDRFGALHLAFMACIRNIAGAAGGVAAGASTAAGAASSSGQAGAGAGAVAAAGRYIEGHLTGGLRSRHYQTQRRTTALALLQLADKKGVVLVRGPPQTGKTSLLQLVEGLAHTPSGLGWQHVLTVSMVNGTSLDDVLLRQASTTWAAFWGSPRSSASGAAVEFERNPKRLLLIDEAQMLFPDEQETVEAAFWANIKGLTDGGSNLPNVAVIMFAMLGDQPSGLPVTACRGGTPVMLDARVEFRSEDEQALMLALSTQEYSELWAAFEQAFHFEQLFTDHELRSAMYEATAGHAGLITTIMDKLAEKLNKRHRAHDEPGSGDYTLQYIFQGDLYARLKHERSLLSVKGMERHKFLLDKVLRSGSRAFVPLSQEEEVGVEELRRAGMLHVTRCGEASFITPLHGAFYQVWLYTLPGMKSVSTEVVWKPEEFTRFLQLSIARMRAKELQESTGVGSDGRPYERHYQMEWYRAARSYLPCNVFIAPDVGQRFGSSGKVDFWIKFPDHDAGWAVELLRDGDRAGEHLARFAEGGKYSGMPIAQYAVIDFRSVPGPVKPVPEVVRVYFQDNFTSAVLCVPGQPSMTVQLAA